MAAAVCERREMLLTNHTLVLVALARDAGLRVRELAEQVGVTERAVETILGDLERAGYLSRLRRGRRNTYQLHPQQPFTHPLLDGVPVGSLIAGVEAGIASTEQPKPGSGEPANPESDVSCASPYVMTILGSTGQSQSEEGTAGRALIYAVLISVLVLATAASALALTGRTITAGHPRHGSIPSASRAAAAAGSASEGSGHTTLTHRTPMILADGSRAVPQTPPRHGQGRTPAPGSTTTVISAPVSGPTGTGGGQTVGGPTLGVTAGVGQTTVTVSAPLPVKLPVIVPVTLPTPPPVAVTLPGLP